jgi:hypothetical protein
MLVFIRAPRCNYSQLCVSGSEPYYTIAMLGDKNVNREKQVQHSGLRQLSEIESVEAQAIESRNPVITSMSLLVITSKQVHIPSPEKQKKQTVYQVSDIKLIIHCG